jgi:methionine-gamma-lyase
MGNMSNKQFKGFSSLAVHGGHVKDPMYAHLTPIYASSTYVYDEAVYQRQRNFQRTK